MLVIILVCQLTAGDKLTSVPEAKLSVATINDHLRPENTIIIWCLENIIIIH